MSRNSDLSALRCGRTFVLRCGRELSAETAPLVEHLIHAQSTGASTILLDLCGSAYADSEGLRCLLRLRDLTECRGIDFRVVVNNGSRISRALSLTGHDRFISLYHSARAAWENRGARRRPTSSAPVHQNLAA